MLQVILIWGYWLLTIIVVHKARLNQKSVLPRTTIYLIKLWKIWISLNFLPTHDYTWLALLEVTFVDSLTRGANWRCKGWLLLVWLWLSVCAALCFHSPRRGHIRSSSTLCRAAALCSAAVPLAESTRPDAACPDQPPRTGRPASCGDSEPGWSPPAPLPLWSKAPGCGLADTDLPPRL